MEFLAISAGGARISKATFYKQVHVLKSSELEAEAERMKSATPI